MAKYTIVSNGRAIDHLHPSTDQHHTDQIKFRTYREEKHALSWVEECQQTHFHEDKFDFLGDGLVLDRAGKQMSIQGYQQMMAKEIKERNYYWATSNRGQPRKRSTIDEKGRNRAINQIPITLRPDHSLALFQIAQKATKPEEQKKFSQLIQSFALRTAKYYAEETGYDVLAVAIHPNEGCLHFHVIYSRVSPDNEHLDNKLGRGTKKQPTAGLPLIGVYRMHDNGIPLPESGYERAQYFMQRRIKGEELPVDLKVSQYLDGLIETLAHKPGLKDYFDWAYETWKNAKAGKWMAQSGAKLSSVKTIEAERLDFER